MILYKRLHEPTEGEMNNFLSSVKKVISFQVVKVVVNKTAVSYGDTIDKCTAFFHIIYIPKKETK